MLSELRSSAGNFAAKILLVFLVLTFAVWGIGDMLRHQGSNPAVATVGDKSITLMQYERAMRLENDNIHRILGDHYSPEIVKNLHLSSRVLQRLIDDSLIRLEGESLGLVPSDADIALHIRSMPAFQDSKGNFDKSLFEASLRSTGQSEKTYVDDLREKMAADMVTETLTAAVPIPDAGVHTLFESRQQQRTATLYTISPGDTGAIPQPTADQIQAYYKDHSAEFSAPEYRTVSYVSFKADDVHGKAAVPADDLQAAYRERIDEFKRPELRTVDQLLYSTADQAKKAYAQLTSGTSFDQVAKTSGILNKDAVSLGEVDRSRITESAESAVFSLKAGGISEPIQTPFGWHIFRVTKISPPTTESFEEARPVLEKDLSQRATDEALNKLANSLEDALAGGSTLQEAATSLGLKVSSVGPLDKRGMAPEGSPARGLPDFDKFLDLAFKTDEKSESSLTTTRSGIYYIVRVDKVTPERVRSLDEVKSLAISGWQKQERNQRLSSLANDVAAKLKNKDGRESVAEQYKLKTAVSAPFKRSAQTAGTVALPPGLVQEVFSHKPGEATSAYPTKDGNYMIAVVKDVLPAGTDTAAGQDKAMADIRQDFSDNEQNEILSQYLRYLAKKYPVTINDELLEASGAGADSDAAPH